MFTDLAGGGWSWARLVVSDYRTSFCCLTATADGIAAERLSGWMLRNTSEYRTAIAAANANMTPSVGLTLKVDRI